MTAPKRTALEILEKAEIDPVVFMGILECALEGFEEEAVEQIMDELRTDEAEAACVYEYVRGVAGGERLVLVETPVDEVEFKTLFDPGRAGNPFVWRTKYLARRGLRVSIVSPYINGKGENVFLFGTDTIGPDKVHQIWKIVPASESLEAR
jgi:hypothetical protein